MQNVQSFCAKQQTENTTETCLKKESWNKKKILESEPGGFLAKQRNAAAHCKCTRR
jgi:hypothetical protein